MAVQAEHSPEVCLGTEQGTKGWGLGNSSAVSGRSFTPLVRGSGFPNAQGDVVTLYWTARKHSPWLRPDFMMMGMY